MIDSLITRVGYEKRLVITHKGRNLIMGKTNNCPLEGALLLFDNEKKNIATVKISKAENWALLKNRKITYFAKPNSV
jgi:hypothetical protein